MSTNAIAKTTLSPRACANNLDVVCRCPPLYCKTGNVKTTNTPLSLRLCSCIFSARSPLRQGPCLSFVASYRYTSPMTDNLRKLPCHRSSPSFSPTIDPPTCHFPRISCGCAETQGIRSANESRGVTSAWVEYGLPVSRDEVRTQNWVGQVFNTSGDQPRCLRANP